MDCALNNLVQKQWKIDYDRLWLVKARVRSIAPVDMNLPKTENRQQWYCMQYEALAELEADITAQEADPARNPGRELRARRGERVPWTVGLATLVNKRRIMHICASTYIRKTEWFPHTGDSESFWQCVSAGHSLNDLRVPVFKNGGVASGGRAGYAWLPLARRVDLDRVYKTLLLRKDFFQNSDQYRRPRIS